MDLKSVVSVKAHGTNRRSRPAGLCAGAIEALALVVSPASPALASAGFNDVKPPPGISQRRRRLVDPPAVDKEGAA